jgi:hypothetical protein
MYAQAMISLNGNWHDPFLLDSKKLAVVFQGVSWLAIPPPISDWKGGWISNS